MIALVACCGAIFWAWRNVSQNSDPVRAEVRSIQDQAISALQSGKPAERVAGIVELERLRTGDSSIAIPPLIGALEDPDTTVRAAAVEAVDSICRGMAKSGSGGEAVSASATAMIRRLKDPDRAVRLAAFKALDSIVSGSVKSGSGGGETIRASATALIGYLKDPDPSARAAAINALGSIGWNVVKSGSNEETVRAPATALFECLKEPEPSVRSAAAISLGQIVSPYSDLSANSPVNRTAVMDALVGLLGDRDAGVRRAALRAITWDPSGSDPPKVLAEALKDESAENRALAVRRLSNYDQGLDPWVPMLLRLAEHDPDPSVREECLRGLTADFERPSGITPAVVPVLTESLSSKDAKIRSHVAWLLGAHKADARAAIPELLRVLNEPVDPQVVPVRGPAGTFDPGCEAAWALGRIAPGSTEAKKVIAALAEVVRSGPQSRGGWAAVALGEFGPAALEALPVLIKLLNDGTPDDKFERHSSAATALGKIAPGSPAADEAVAALLPVLERKSGLPRLMALRALAQFGPKAAAAIPRIRVLKDDRDAEVRNAAANALPAIENKGTP
jgi:HEAT repeat protein